MSMRSYSEVIEEALKIQKVKAGEKVAILTNHKYDKYTLDAWMTALCNLDAQFLHIVAPPITKSTGAQSNVPKTGGAVLVGPASEFLVSTLKNADMVVHVETEFGGHIGTGKLINFFDMPYISMYSDEYIQTLYSKKRWLDVMVDEINFRRLFPNPNLMKRTKAGAEMMHTAKTMRIVSKAGTDLTLDKTGRKGHAQCGVADEPGRWDNYGFGLVACAPLEDSANGTLVLDAGDYILGIDRDVTEPVKMTLKDGKITKIEGGFTAKLLDRWFKSWKNPESYGTSHIGWGTNVETGVWIDHGLFCVSDAESYEGIMQIAFGSNYFDTPIHLSGMAGKRRVPSHCDIDLLNHDYYLDDELICKEGIIVHPKAK